MLVLSATIRSLGKILKGWIQDGMMDIGNEMKKLDGTSINMEDLDLAFDQWVHTERRITITHCAPDSLMAEQMKAKDTVYPITRYVRGRVLLLSNASYQVLRLLKDLFTQMNYTVRTETGKSEKDIRGIINSEAHNEDNRYVDSFVVIIYGTPDDFEFDYIPTTLNDENAPLLKGKPKLIYVIGDDSIVRQIEEVGRKNQDPDFLSVSTGFNGIMFYIFILREFAHELSAQNIWKLMLQNASIHRFAASTHYTLKKEFYFFPGLTSSVFPDEIEKMEPEDMQLYTKMLEKGKVKTYNIRLMFVGLYGAGKTSTARRILGKKIDDVTSTDGMDVHTGRCKIDIRERKWKIYNDTPASLTHKKLKDLHFADVTTEEQLPDIKNLEFRELRLQRKTSEDSTHVIEMDEDNDNTSKSHRTRTLSNKRSIDECHGNEFDDDTSSLASSSASTSSVTSKYRRLNMRSISSSSYSDDFEIVNDETGSIKRARQAMAADTANKGSQYAQALVSLWDFAGQFVYYPTPQLFFSQRLIYLLVLNMEDDLEKTLNDWYMDIRGEQSIETKGGINFWLRCIFTYAKGSSSGIPPIIIVGTHGDKLKGNDAEKMNKAKAYFRKIRNVFQGSPHLNNIRHEFFLLDNTKENTELERLKDTILSISETMPYWGELIPAKWLELEQVLDEKRLEGKQFITMKQLVQLDNTLTSPLKDKKQLQLFLKAHHDTGSIIHFGDSDKLNKFIILQPQWIINAFRSLIGALDFRINHGNLQSQWEEFNENGRLTSEFARQIWALDEENSFLENSDLLLDVLEELDIIAMASVLTEDGEAVRKLDFYYVPCMLKEIPPITLLQKQERIGSFSTPVLCLSFCNDFMPPAIFYRVVALCIGKWPIAKNGKKILMYCGCAVFEVNYRKGEDLHRLYLFCRQSKIGLRITRYSSKKAGMVDPNICDRVRRFITSAVKKEFIRFQVEQNSEEARYFSYELQCKETTEDDVLDEGLHSEKDLLNAMGTDFFCAEHSDKTDPHSLKPVEMLHEWFNGKIPRGIPLEGPSVFDEVIRLKDSQEDAILDDIELTKLLLKEGRTSWKVIKECQKICQAIKDESEHIAHVEAAYRFGDDKHVIFLVFAAKNIKIDLRWETEIRIINNYSDESRVVLHCKESSPLTEIESQKIAEIIDMHSKKLMFDHKFLSAISASSVLSRHFGPMRYNKHKIEKRPCIVFNVLVKGIIPLNEEYFPTELDGTPVDVREGGVRLCVNKAEEHQKNTTIGCKITSSTCPGKSGTLGGFIEHPEYGLCGITCAHVVANDDDKFQLKEMSTITVDGMMYQPDVCVPENKLGKLVQVTYREGENGKPGVDLALFRIETRAPKHGQFPDGTLPSFNAGLVWRKTGIPDVRREVRKFGYVTLNTSGVMVFDNCAIKEIPFHSYMTIKDGTKFTTTLYKQYHIKSRDENIPFCDLGDSGALVFMEDNTGEEPNLRCIGMLVGVFPDKSGIVTPINAILDELKVKQFKPFTTQNILGQIGMLIKHFDSFNERFRKLENRLSRIEADNNK